MKTIMAGEVLTLPLLRRVDKAAYQYGGFKVVGEITKGTPSNWIIATVIIERKYISGSIDTFKKAFEKTMNSAYYKIAII